MTLSRKSSIINEKFIENIKLKILEASKICDPKGKGNIANLAALLNVNRNEVYEWMHGNTIISCETCVKIEIVTHGKIKRRDLRPDIFGELEY